MGSTTRKATTLAFANEKGGTGKTTACSTFANILSEMGKKVLLVDMDPQPGNLSFTLRADREGLLGTYELICDDRATAEDCIQPLSFCDIAAADSTRLKRGAVELATDPDRDYRLTDALEEVADAYDYILIDTPPTTDVLTINALVAADEVIIPTDPDYASAYGMSREGLLRTIDRVRRHANPSLKVAGILISCYNQRTRFGKSFRSELEQISESSGMHVFSATIRQSVRVREAREKGMGLVEYLKGRREAVVDDYRAAVAEWLESETNCTEGSK